MSFDDIIGQHKAKNIISGQLKSSRVSHAYLFLGPEGTGRKKLAFELAKALNCKNNAGKAFDSCGACVSCSKINNGLHPDVQLIDFAWQARFEDKDPEKQKAIKIDTIRALQKEVNLKPTEGRWKVFVIEPAEKITLDAANCLLKTLEEPPQWTVIILLALHKDNLPATVVSRAQIIPFGPLSQEAVAGYISSKQLMTQEQADIIARMSEGSLSEALSFADKKAGEVNTVWENIKNRKMSTVEALSYSQEYAKEAEDFIDELLMAA
jgi:DNA polymerase III subunit delta'